MEPKCFYFHFSCFYRMESYFLTFLVENFYSEMRKKKILQKTKEDGRLTKNEHEIKTTHHILQIIFQLHTRIN